MRVIAPFTCRPETLTGASMSWCELGLRPGRTCLCRRPVITTVRPLNGRLTTLDVPAVTRWSSGSRVLRRHGLLPFDGTELVADDREREVECFRGHRLEVLVGCMP